MTVESEGGRAAFYASALVWDQHGCLPLRPDESAVDSLDLYRVAGVDHISVNIGFDLTPPRDAREIAQAFQRGLADRRQRFALAGTTADVRAAKASGKLAVTFDLEGTEPLDGDVGRLTEFYELGVRTVLIAYNRRNRAGGGCHDATDSGLTAYGRELVREMNELGVLVDATHCSAQTTFDLFETSSAPVIFSHVVPAGVWQHPRNVTDDQMRGCAATGGVVGINGVGIFLGANDASVEAVVRAVDYAATVVGIEHVGLGLDFVFDQDELSQYVAQRPDVFPHRSSYGRATIEFFPPRCLEGLANALLDRFSEDDVRMVLGSNFERVATAVW